MGGVEGYAGLEIYEIEEAVQPDSAEIAEEGYGYLPGAHADMAHVAKGGTEADGKGRVAKPAEDYPIDYKKDREASKVEGKIAEILYHGKARADERTIDDTIGDIIKFVTQ